VDLGAWTPSLVGAVETGATFTTGFPIASAERANDRGQAYYGPVVLVTDARCYSATDIFAAGFADHRIGPVLGVARHTGAGGANVWTHELLRRLLPAGDAVLAPLPRQATFRVALRRTLRVGPHAGELLEDLGVVASEVHDVTERDLLEDNADLLEAAAALLAGTPVRRLEVTVAAAPGGLSVAVRAEHLERVDAYLGGRPLGSWDVVDGACGFGVDPAVAPPGSALRVEGHAEGGLRAVKLVRPAG
jgi:hypothetical protein